MTWLNRYRQRRARRAHQRVLAHVTDQLRLWDDEPTTIASALLALAAWGKR